MSHRLSSLPTAFYFLGCYGLGFGALLVPIGLFVGPQILAAGVGHLLAGIVAFVVASGLRRQAPWAWWGAAIVSLAVVLLMLTATIASSQELAAMVFFGVVSALFLAVFVQLVLGRGRYRAASRQHRPAARCRR